MFSLYHAATEGMCRAGPCPAKPALTGGFERAQTPPVRVGIPLDRNRGSAHTQLRILAMPYRNLFLFAVLGMALPVGAQSVISTRSGVLHFFEGSVYLDGQPLESHLGRYPTMPQGGELRTEDGKAEVLLTPGVFLRLSERSSIRLLGNDLADTRVELLAGSAIVDSGEPNPGTSVTLSYRDWKVHFLEKGAYRIDADPPRLWVRQGEAEVRAGIAGEPVPVRQGMSLAFGGLLLPEQASSQSGA